MGESLVEVLIERLWTSLVYAIYMCCLAIHSHLNILELCTDDDDLLKARYEIFVKHAERWPTSKQLENGLNNIKLEDIKSTGRSSAMKPVGHAKDQCSSKDSSTKYYERCVTIDKNTFKIRSKRGRKAIPHVLNPRRCYPVVEESGKSSLFSLLKTGIALIVSNTFILILIELYTIQGFIYQFQVVLHAPNK